MLFLKKLINRSQRQQPNAQYQHATLGKMVWSIDGEVWVGAFGELKYWIAYEYSPTPKQEILEYALSILTDELWLDNILREVKEKITSDYESIHIKDADNLAITTLSFHSKDSLSIQFFEGNNSPWWVADIKDRSLLGVTLDT